MNDSIHRIDMCVRADDRARSGDVPIEGSGVHCVVGRQVAHRNGIVRLKHDTCGLGNCNCPCHFGGKS